MRAFIAIELDDTTRGLLCDVQNRLKAAGVRGNYSRAENLHITIKFLGEIDQAVYHKICAMLEKTAPKHKSFVLSLDKIGKFDKGNKKILWAGLKKSEELTAIHDNIVYELEKIMTGLLIEKKYSPHITLVREAVLPEGWCNFESTEHSFTVSGLSLMESTRVDGRLTYIRRAFESFGQR